VRVDIKFETSRSDDYHLYIDALDTLSFDGKVAIITNPKVAGLHLQKLLSKIDASELYIITVPDGESYKNQESIDLILENLLNHRFDRKSHLIAFGGGVIGDMTGYVASIFQRGISFTQIPTTLLSQVDASVGGKTGINTRFGKNLIGAFHQPQAVYIESAFLETLASREFSAGVAEIVKMAVMFDASFFAWLENADLSDKADLAEAIQKSVETKARVVAMDEKEQGVRAVLNYGHTFGHVIEQETAYRLFLHGEAVAIGMNMANHLALKLGYLNEEALVRIERLLKKYALPTQYDIKDEVGFYEGFFLDKKTSHSQITFILPDGIGGYKIEKSIDRGVVLSVLKNFKHRGEVG
jgi:3-dehydroquinate synthase